jgi:hypothetical protein
LIEDQVAAHTGERRDRAPRQLGDDAQQVVDAILAIAYPNARLGTALRQAGQLGQGQRYGLVAWTDALDIERRKPRTRGIDQLQSQE